MLSNKTLLITARQLFLSATNIALARSSFLYVHGGIDVQQNACDSGVDRRFEEWWGNDGMSLFLNK